jgi:phage/plasmid-like protein (TIGR03299 family)
MAHNLNLNKKTQKYAFAAVKEKAWHGLGQILDNPMTSEEAINEAQLNFNVIKEKVKFDFGKKLKTFDTKFVTLREDTGDPFGIVGADYHIVQNADAFTFFDSIVGKNEAIYETAGALYDGRKIFITAKMPDYIQLPGDDLIEKYLFLMTTHDGSGSIIAAFTPIRIVCNNTLNAAIRGIKGVPGPVIKIRHTANAKERLEEAGRIMGISNKLTTEMQDIFEKMSKKKIVEKKLVDMIVVSLSSDEVLNKWHKQPEEVSTNLKNQVEAILEYYEAHDSQKTKAAKGTVFGAYNAITGYFQNVKNFKNGTEKLTNILDGTVYRKQQKAFDLCLEMVK